MCSCKEPHSSASIAGTTSTSCSAAADQVGLDLQTATSSSSAQTAPSYTELRRHSSRFAPSTAQRPLPTAPSTTQASDSADSTHARFAPQPSASCETGPSLRDVPHITFNGRDTLSTVQAGKDAADASDQSPQAALTLPKPGSVSDQTASATTLQLSFGASQTVLSPLHDNSLPSAAVQKQDAASAQALQRLSLKGSGLSAARARSSVGRWEPMQASVDSPEKQELGRRRFYLHCTAYSVYTPQVLCHCIALATLQSLHTNCFHVLQAVLNANHLHWTTGRQRALRFGSEHNASKSLALQKEWGKDETLPCSPKLTLLLPCLQNKCCDVDTVQSHRGRGCGTVQTSLGL